MAVYRDQNRNQRSTVNLIYSEPSQFDVSDLLNYRPNVNGNPKNPEGLVGQDRNFADRLSQLQHRHASNQRRVSPTAMRAETRSATTRSIR